MLHSAMFTIYAPPSFVNIVTRICVFVKNTLLFRCKESMKNYNAIGLDKEKVRDYKCMMNIYSYPS